MKHSASFPPPYLTDCPDKSWHYVNNRYHQLCAVPNDFDAGTGRSKTMIQVRCPTCHLFKCWVPKGEQDGDYAVFKDAER